ncbi:leucyl aminopeptidase [uncultured Piscinibacter sp.]|uniref:leucyl aminopeptidase n=1 Tax=uncultured Piscinibacter sp. TaxID=1131835 RepID=UPI002611A30E|nr:leucyl aminopeptidase [uncultured Piscinibacter sp.]
MDFRQQNASLDAVGSVACDALLVVVAGEKADASLDGSLKRALDDAVAHGDFELKRGKTIYLHRPPGVKATRVVFAACGAATLKSIKAAFAAGVAALKGGGAKHLAVALSGAGELGAEHAEALVAAAGDATYVYRHTKPSAPAASALARITLLCEKSSAKPVAQGLARGQAIAAGVTLAREFANRPGNHCTPTFLGDQVKKLGKEFGLKVDVLDRKAIEKLGMGAFLAVAQGSAEHPRFVVAQYQGAPKAQAPVVLVGKGITFDTGGISIKPAAEMDEMKFDMGGAASVIGTLRAVAELKPKLNLVVVVPTCENMPGDQAIKPGDVVTSMSGQTIEILNTDAEGRLILCDALTYAERFKPACVIDVATLTGACVVALGHHHSGLFTADDSLAEQLLAASRAALDPCWRMPLDEEYDEALKSNFADMGNVGGRAGGAITAAMFLRKFTGKFRWAHLDIAGTAWKSGAAKGATGRPVPLLTHFVLAQAA